MNTKQKLHQLHLNEWASRFADQKASGLTVRQWCDQSHYSIEVPSDISEEFLRTIIKAVRYA